MNPKKQIFYTLDGIRGIASILVVLRHTLPFFNFEFQESYLAVDIFFLMSGVVISQAYQNRLENGLSVFNFMLIRLIRIYPIYLLATLLGVVSTIMNLNEDITAHNNLFGLYLRAILLVPNFRFVWFSYLFPLNPPAWSLFLEMVVNIFYAYIIKFLTKTLIAIIMLISGLSMAFSIYAVHPHNLDLGWNNAHIFAGFTRVFYSFFAGIALYHLYKKKPHLNQSTNIISSLILATIFAILIASPNVKIVPYFDLIMVIAIFPALIYAAMLFQPTGILAKICQFFGLISYAIYVLHYPLSHLIKAVCDRKGIIIEHYAPIGGIYLLLFLVIICWLIDKYYDLSIRKYLRKLISY
jgi:peptidoglycan/LPS O-acetylase OafA/YrhL